MPNKLEPEFGAPATLPRTRITRTYCVPCLNNHSSQCHALADSENGCQCRCDSSVPNLEGKTPAQVSRYRAREDRVTTRP